MTECDDYLHSNFKFIARNFYNVMDLTHTVHSRYLSFLKCKVFLIEGLPVLNGFH